MKKIFILFFTAFTTYGYSATWTNMKNYNAPVNDLKAFNGNLFIGGDFSSSNTQAAYWTSVYNGSTFTHNTTAINGTGVVEFEVFNNQLYSVGGFDFGASSGVSKWNGSAWVSEGVFTGSFSSIVANGNQLYVGSNTGVVYTKTGTGGSYTAMPAIGTGPITAMAVYNNELYVAGTFILYGTTVMNNIARWDGTTWQPLGSGFNAGVTGGTINSMMEYNGQLYVGGTFSTAGGVSVNSIARWNGSTWTAVGSGVTGGSNGIRDMVVYNNALYVVGQFTTAGGMSSKNVAKWTGSAWMPMTLWNTNQYVETIEEYNNKLYVGTNDNDTAHVYRMDSETGLEEVNYAGKISLYPNPANDVVWITLDADAAKDAQQVVISDMLGRNVFAKDIQALNGVVTLDISAIASGRYVLTIVSEKRRQALPFVKQ